MLPSAVTATLPDDVDLRAVHCTMHELSSKQDCLKCCLRIIGSQCVDLTMWMKLSSDSEQQSQHLHRDER